jgi:ectoine hydroxylase-related dioxygenase (phytanoyl-CoA dioxygenase family)
MNATPVASPKEDLDTPFVLTDAQRAFFRENGYIKLKGVLSPETLAFYGREITGQVQRLNTQVLPLEKRDTYGKAFLQIMNIWTQSEVVKEFVFSRKLARLAAELMGVSGVRLYHDQALYKEAGGGATPWHADQFYWPVAGDNTVTVWVPLQATPMEMGPLAFAPGSHRIAVGRDIAISDESEKLIAKTLREAQLELVETAFELGEVSYHLGWTFHRAGANRTSDPRRVMTVIYLEEDARLIAPKHKNHQQDWDAWMPGVKVGEIVNSPLNPVLWSGRSR